MKIWTALAASSAIAFIVAAAAAQTGAPPTTTGASSSLPPGLIRQGGVVMMRPVSESDQRPLGATIFEGERRTASVGFLSASDHEIFSRAVEAAIRGDWAAARGLADQGRDPTARLIIEWAYLQDRNGGAPFDQIAQFLKNRPEWPGRKRLLASAEKAMAPNMDPQAVIAWFGDRRPETGMGKIRLGEALITTGSVASGREWIRQAWAEDNFEPDQQVYVISRHGDLLAPELDRERLDMLFAHNELSEAKNQTARVSPDVQRLASARLLLRSDPARGEAEASALPAAMRNDPGLLFDEVKVLRQRNEIAQISTFLFRVPIRELAKLDPGRWWTELNLDVRAALQDGLYLEAYTLAAGAELPPDSSEYAESEFLAGWIALRELNEPRRALVHFENLAHAVSRPISRARARYWAGRAREASGDMSGAWQEYRAASEDPETYYGQLALTKISAAPPLHIRSAAADAADLHTSYEREELTRAIHILADLGLESALREFALQDADVRQDAAHVKALAEDLTRIGFREIAVRVAKEASYTGIRLPEFSHPVIVVPRYAGPGTEPETALVLSIIRQETEFDPDSVSGAGARGIMQLMPDSARHDAGLAGLSYSFQDLVGSSSYNMELGMTELAGDLTEWNGSYVLAAASYNAGRGNVRKWIAAFGDPRGGRTDPVDWVERIPFSETRNYVQRVLENVQVYRDRLAGRSEPLRILSDLYRPLAPQNAVLPYVASESAVPTSASVPKPPLEPEHPSTEPANTAPSGPTAPTIPVQPPTPRFKPAAVTTSSPEE
ncbi:MAG TPA: transglycosylase SLT domain-containing protein [Rhizomicrobium sp.]|jgi:soluble lytic murein transglycosylase